MLISQIKPVQRFNLSVWSPLHWSVFIAIVPGHDVMLVLLIVSLQSQQLPVQKTMVGLLKTKKKFSQLVMNLKFS